MYERLSMHELSWSTLGCWPVEACAHPHPRRTKSCVAWVFTHLLPPPWPSGFAYIDS